MGVAGGGAGQGGLGGGPPELLQGWPKPRILQHVKNNSSHDTGLIVELMNVQGIFAVWAMFYQVFHT